MLEELQSGFAPDHTDVLNHDQEQFFYSFRLDEAVPQDQPGPRGCCGDPTCAHGHRCRWETCRGRKSGPVPSTDTLSEAALRLKD
jgi:hypothetical protein